MLPAMNLKRTLIVLFFSSRRRHTISKRDWSSDVCSSDLQKRQTADPTKHTDIIVTVNRHQFGLQFLLFGRIICFFHFTLNLVHHRFDPRHLDLLGDRFFLLTEVQWKNNQSDQNRDGNNCKSVTASKNIGEPDDGLLCWYDKVFVNHTGRVSSAVIPHTTRQKDHHGQQSAGKQKFFRTFFQFSYLLISLMFSTFICRDQ